jgi:hypothetical protein
MFRESYVILYASGEWFRFRGWFRRFLFMRTSSIEINSSHVRKVANCCGDDEDNVLPYISFCTPNSLQGRPGIIGVHN